jgi:hypothetical protein
MGQRVEDNLNRLLRRTHVLIERERETILRVGHALEQHKTLAGEDVVAVIELRQGTVADGTIYTDREFLAEIEQYHERMLGAHQDGLQRIDFEPPGRNALRTAVEPGRVTGNGHAPVAPVGENGASGNGAATAEPGEVAITGDGAPAFLDHLGNAIVGPGTSQLLKADSDDEEDDEATGAAEPR